MILKYYKIIIIILYLIIAFLVLYKLNPILQKII